MNGGVEEGRRGGMKINEGWEKGRSGVKEE